MGIAQCGAARQKRSQPKTSWKGIKMNFLVRVVRLMISATLVITYGYLVERAAKNASAKAMEKGIDKLTELNDMSVEDVRNVAKDLDIEGYAKMRKIDLIKAVVLHTINERAAIEKETAKKKEAAEPSAV